MNYNLLLHIDANDERVFRLLMDNVKNYLNGLPNEDFLLQVVANGPAVSLFVKARADLRELAKPLHDRGAIFKVCANALAANKISHEDVWSECQIVDAGLIEIVRLQNDGYAYVKP